MNDMAKFSFASSGLRKSIQGIVCFLELGVRSNGPRLGAWALLRNLSAANRMALSEETLKNLPFFYGYKGNTFLGIHTVTVFQLLNWNCVFRASS